MATVGLMAVAVPSAFAQVTPDAWIQYSPSYKVQQEGCGKVDNLTFQLTCSKTSGKDRAERRYDDYSSGGHKFEGTFKITSMSGTRVCLKQTFDDKVGPYFMLAVENGGRLYAVEDGKTISTGATVGTPITVDTIHQVGKTIQVYINGSLKYTGSSKSGSFYDKFGAYRTDSGKGQITVQWSNLTFYHD
ncbi:MAG TPA: hypothetical protein VGN81_39120 [Pseudonocardiaceae bacterium]